MKIQNNHKYIIRDGKEIGYLQLVKDTKLSIPELEYLVDEYYEGQGIMSVELPKYLQELKAKGITRLIANVKNNNVASIKLLKKYGVRISRIKDVDVYVILYNLIK
tara:strand:- start:4259 stop:4576 length:318 start_codon:yes stop_codon:yes gene_type:complete